MALPKFFSEGPGKHKKSQKQEKRLADVLDGHVQKGSGSKSFHKGDVKAEVLLVEAKRTDNDSMSIKKAWFIKVFKEASAYSKIPALSIEFDSMPDIVPRDWVAIPSKTLAMFVDFYLEYKDIDEEDDE